nr:MAG TPA: hypothetical protein [Bacteriophage sp.]
MIKIMNYIDLIDTLKTYSFDELYNDITIEITDGENQSFYSSDLYDITTDQDDEGKLIIKIYR